MARLRPGNCVRHSSHRRSAIQAVAGVCSAGGAAVRANSPIRSSQRAWSCQGEKTAAPGSDSVTMLEVRRMESQGAPPIAEPCPAAVFLVVTGQQQAVVGRLVAVERQLAGLGVHDLGDDETVLPMQRPGDTEESTRVQPL